MENDSRLDNSKGAKQEKAPEHLGSYSCCLYIYIYIYMRSLIKGEKK